MILLCGLSTESSFAAVADALARRGIAYVHVNQRDVRSIRLQVEVAGTRIGGKLTGPGYDIDLDRVTAVYLRFMDDRFLPEIEREPGGSPIRESSRAFHDLFGQWADVTHGRVVNRYLSMGSNFSKPYQSQLIRACGFDVPETLITNQPELARAFAAEHGSVIYKSMSGERSIVALLDPNDDQRLERIRDCPVQFQEFVDGPNVRVHTVGRDVFATTITTEAIDYRYAVRQAGMAAHFAPFDLPDEISERCVHLAASLGLELAGLDLKLARDGRVVCLEVNPSPVFSYYEQHTGQPIGDAVARLLATGA
jgi:hypothetical protein